MSGPHTDLRVVARGTPVAEADGVVLFLHGRGGSAEDILSLAGEVPRDHLAYLAPQAFGNTWYPLSFLAPLEDNEPHLSSALAAIETVVRDLEEHSIPTRSILLVGFSQGACLALEYVARHPRRYGGVAALTGGLLGPGGGDWGRFHGDLFQTPVLLASGDPDPHVPWRRVEESGDVLESLGARVTLHRYPGLPHTINRDEIELLRGLVDRLPLRSESA